MRELRQRLSTGTAGSTGTAARPVRGGLTGAGGNVSVGNAQCSDGLDNDGDGKIDYADPECVGPLDNDEGTFATGIPGDNSDACKQDCFFDGNSGMGDDHCLWQLKCDPAITSGECAVRSGVRDVARDRVFGGVVAVADSASTTAASWCRTAATASAAAASPARPRPIRLAPTCTAADFNDPVKCPRCTQVTQCMVPCGHLRDLRRQDDAASGVHA